MLTDSSSEIYDIAVIGGGVNGCGIARDAAGRSWRVLLCERQDLASGTSSASTKLIHGGLRYLEQYEFRLVREALTDHDGCYIFQNADKRIFFVISYEEDFSLIGTTDQDYKGDPADVHASVEEIDYLCRSASEYLRHPITPDMVVWTYSGVRPLHSEGDSVAQKITRDYVLKLDAPSGAAPLLSIFGGKITTFRKLSESALADLAPHLPPATGRPAGWTGREPLPGGDFPMTGFTQQVSDLRAAYPFLSPRHARRLVRAYGTRSERILHGARSAADLGRNFGADFTEAELRYLVASEWARTAQDVVWHRSKLGLRLSPEQIRDIDAALAEMVTAAVAA